MINAKKLISRHGEPVIYYQQTGGGWNKDTGTYDKPTAEGVNQVSALASLSDEDLRNTDGGQYTGDDLKAYTVHKWEVGAHVKRVGTDKTYRVAAILRDYEFHVGAFVFHLTRQGVSVP